MPEIEDAQATAAVAEGAQAVTPSSEIDEKVILNHPTYKAAIQGMSKSQHEAAEYKKVFEEVGFTPEQVKQSLMALKTNPKGFRDDLNAYLKQNGLEEMAPAKNDPDPENFYENDQLFNSALTKRESALMAKLEAKFAPEIASLKGKLQAYESKEFKSNADKAIETVLGKHPDCGVTKEKLMEVAIAKSIPPEKIKWALIEAMGEEKYDDYIANRKTKTATEEVENKNLGVAPTLGGGGKNPVQIPNTFKEADGSFNWEAFSESGGQALAALRQKMK